MRAHKKVAVEGGPLFSKLKSSTSSMNSRYEFLECEKCGKMIAEPKELLSVNKTNKDCDFEGTIE